MLKGNSTEVKELLIKENAFINKKGENNK